MYSHRVRIPCAMQAANRHYKLLTGAVIIHVFTKNFDIKTYDALSFCIEG
jgi:hypothetical protein